MMKIVFIFITVLASAQSKDFVVEKIRSVYDGDTFRADLNCVEPFFCSNMSIRVYGVDTEEIKSKTQKSLDAKNFTKSFLAKKPIILKECKPDKYFRIDCAVYNKDGMNLSEELIKRGFGKPYFGGTKN